MEKNTFYEEFNKYLVEKFFEEKKKIFYEVLDEIWKEFITEAIKNFIDKYVKENLIETKIYENWTYSTVCLRDYINDVIKIAIGKEIEKLVSEDKEDLIKKFLNFN